MNTLNLALILGFLLTPFYVLIQLKLFSFSIRFLKLNKSDKPDIILALIMVEFLNISSLIKEIDILNIVSSIVILIKIYGLYYLKRWVIYLYLGFALIFEIIFFISIEQYQENLLVFFASLFSQLLVLGIYYFYVYYPNKERFNN